MIISLTGTPGTGKSSVSKALEKKGFEVVDLNKVASGKDFFVGIDKGRESRIIDTDKLNKHVEESYGKKDLVFVEGHLSHLLKCADKVIVLRCHPGVLGKRLASKGWKKKKVKENVEAELLDVILCETVEAHARKNIFEIDTTDKSVDSVVSSVMEIIRAEFRDMKKYNIGMVDWSEEILKDF